MAVFCLESACRHWEINPSRPSFKTVLGPQGAKSSPKGNLLVLGGCFSQYIPPLYSEQINCFDEKCVFQCLCSHAPCGVYQDPNGIVSAVRVDCCPNMLDPPSGNNHIVLAEAAGGLRKCFPKSHLGHRSHYYSTAIS